MYKNCIKRLLDILLSLFALLVLGLPMLVLALVIRVTIGSPVLFRQQRVGKGDKPFSLMKFRSMTDARDANGVYLPDEERITKLGHFLRTTSLDELPEPFSLPPNTGSASRSVSVMNGGRHRAMSVYTTPGR